MKSKYPFILIAVVFVFCLTTIMSSVLEARGRGGGGGFSRGGPAAGGGFSSRPAVRQPARQAPRQEIRREQPVDRNRDRDDRQDYQDEAREDRQDYRDKAREDRQDYLDDDWDDHNHDDYHGGAAFVTGVAVGAAASSDYVTSVPCSTTVVVNGSTYYHCGSTWYSRGNEGGEVVYIIVSPPAGY